MRVGRKLRPGQPGTKKLTKRFGERLVCVRYRYDVRRKKRYTTVELIVSAADWTPKEVAVRIAYHEGHIRQHLKRAGGRWDPERKVWHVGFAAVEALGLQDRVVREPSPVYYWTTPIDQK